MSYEMSNQNMAYPYPPPAAAVIPAPKSRFSKWWPISFFIAAVLFFVIGGGLVGAWSASYTCDLSGWTSYCGNGNDGEFYGGVAMLVIGGLCKLTAWIMLIVWCVKRSSRQPTSVAYTYQPINYAAPTAPAAPAPPAPLHYQAPQPYQNAPPYQNSPSPAPHSKEGGGIKYCGQCGAAATTPFCPQCGIRV
jgi:hypothetical protein